MAAAGNHHDVARGTTAMALGVAVFSLHDMVGKVVVERYPVIQMLAIRSGLALLIMLAVVRFRGGVPPLQRENVPGHVVRLTAMLGAILLFFSALQRLPLADATAIVFGAPFLMLLLSRPLLGERVPGPAWAAVAVGFVGVLVIVRPGRHVEPAALLALGASVCYALGMTTTRRLGRTESVLGMLFWMIAGQFVLAGLAAPWVWEPVAAGDWPLLAGLAALNLLGQLGLVRAFALAPPAAVAPFEYTALVWAALLGFVVFGDVPSARVWVGAAIIVGAGLYVLRVTRAAPEPVRVPAAAPPG